MTELTGAVVVGGNLNGLSIARSLGRRGVPVWVVSTPNIRLASFSRYTRRTILWSDCGDETQVEFLLDLADRNNLNRWVLFPTSDESAALLSKYRTQLSTRYCVSTPDWSALKWAYDKRLTYRLAEQQQVDYPATFYPNSESDLDAVALPAILKPATHAVVNRFTAAKAWAVENREELICRYVEARSLMPADLILAQERIRGGGESQFSYAALCRDGKPIASLTARRTRQFPIDFGYSSSFVETMDVPEIVAPSLRLLDAMKYTGIVEIEYKYDARDDRYKLLDINPRLWTWAPLGARAGVDFPLLLWRLMLDMPVPELTAPPGVRWVRVSTDVPAAIHEMLRGRLNLFSYLHSMRSPLEFALVTADDPLPGLLDLPLYVFKHLHNRFAAARKGVPSAGRYSIKN
jgi:predicted ATP-grasp superfamily ATP-dependent carboligase